MELCKICGGKTVKKKLPTRRNSLYLIDGIEEPLISVTTILGVIDKPQLLWWAAQTAAEIALEDPSKTARECASGIYKKRDRAGDRGSDVHGIIAGGKYNKKDMGEDIVGYINAYEKFRSMMPSTSILKESIVFSKKWGYAGQLDRLMKMADGKVWVVDFKTNKSGIFAETGLQLSAYKHALLEMGRVKKIDGLAGVHLTRDGEWKFMEFQDQLKPFLAAKALYEWKNIKK